MTDAAVTGAASVEHARPAGRNRRRRDARHAPKVRKPLDGDWKLPTDQLFAAVAAAPSRSKMDRPYPRQDLRENFSRFYEAVWRHGIAAGSAQIDTTWTQLAIAMGYPKEDAARMRGSLWNWLQLAIEIGVLEGGGVKDLDGAWQRLDVTLVAPAGVAQSVRAAELWRPITRRRESRKQRHERRQQPWRRCAGRSRAMPRWDVPGPRRAGQLPGSSPAVPGTRLPGTSSSSRPYLCSPSCPVRARSEAPRPDRANRERADARAPGRGAVDAIERACPPGARAALNELRSRGVEAGGLESLAAVRERPGEVPIVAVALAGWEAVMPAGREPRLSRRWAARLTSAAGQLDRLRGPGAAAAMLLDRLADVGPNGHDLQPGAGLAEIHTLAYFAAELRAAARDAVRYDRWRRGKRATPAPRPHTPRGRA